MIAKLVVASGKSAGRAIAIKRATLLIGRSEDCDVRPLSEEVSRRHCAVHVGPAEVWVEDLKSRNGTFVNGSRIEAKTKVADGDIIRVGSLELKVSISDPAARAGSADDVSRWLVADEQPAGMFDTTQTLQASSKASSKASSDDAEAPIAKAAPADDSAVTSSSGIDAGGDTARSSTTLAIDALKSANAKPSGLPQAPKKSADSSRDAAAEALRKFFEKR